MNDRLTQTLQRIDDQNRADPSMERVGDTAYPKALLYGLRMTEWLHRLQPNPSEVLQIAARGQHIGRWMIPRSDYPANRSGYLAWRTRLYGFHAEQVARIMRQTGYSEETIDLASRIIAKKGLRQEPDAQLIEDVACLVFLNHEFERFAAEHPRDKIVEIVGKTWRKMSDLGRAAASSLPLSQPLAELVRDALRV